MSRKIRVFIVASILLNFLLGGVILGHVLRVMGRGGHLPEIDAKNINISTEQLTRIQTKLHAVHLANGELFESVEEQRKKALQTILKEPFNEVTYQQQIESIHQLRGQAMQRIADEVKKMALHLDLNERGALVGILRHPPPPESPVP